MNTKLSALKLAGVLTFASALGLSTVAGAGTSTMYDNVYKFRLCFDVRDNYNMVGWSYTDGSEGLMPTEIRLLWTLPSSSSKTLTLFGPIQSTDGNSMNVVTLCKDYVEKLQFASGTSLDALKVKDLKVTANSLISGDPVGSNFGTTRMTFVRVISASSANAYTNTWALSGGAPLVVRATNAGPEASSLVMPATAP